MEVLEPCWEKIHISSCVSRLPAELFMDLWPPVLGGCHRIYDHLGGLRSPGRRSFLLFFPMRRIDFTRVSKSNYGDLDETENWDSIRMVWE